MVSKNGKYVSSNGDCKETFRKFLCSKTNPRFLFIYNNATSKKLKNIHKIFLSTLFFFWQVINSTSFAFKVKEYTL